MLKIILDGTNDRSNGRKRKGSGQGAMNRDCSRRLHASAIAKACGRPRRLVDGPGGSALREVRLVLPWDVGVRWSDCPDVFDQLDGLRKERRRGGGREIDVRLVLHHGGFAGHPTGGLRQGWGHDGCEEWKVRESVECKLCLLQEAYVRGWSLGHVEAFTWEFGYEVLKDEYIMEEVIPGWTAREQGWKGKEE